MIMISGVERVAEQEGCGQTVVSPGRAIAILGEHGLISYIGDFIRELEPHRVSGGYRLAAVLLWLGY